MNKIAIIGAGASGTIAAIVAKTQNKSLDIDIFDINSSIGKKILASGNGRCNISNTDLEVENFIGENPFFVEYALKQFSFKTFENFCKSIGLLLNIKQNNKVYPLSNEAKSVVSLLESCLQNLGVNLILNTRIQSIKKEANKFILISKNAEYKGYNKVLISSGLQAAPQLNATDDGISLAQKFGHTWNLIYPSLVGLHADFKYNNRIQGVKKEAKVCLYINGQKECEIFGDILFTKYGLSGFAILDISQYTVPSLLLKKDVQVSINLFPKMNRNEVLRMIESLFKTLPTHKVSTLLTGIISNKLVPVILDICKIDKQSLVKDINAKNIREIVNMLINWRFKICGTQGFKHAEASGGGIKTNEVDNKTYESKKCKELYFAGELLDIVGKRGGYNLHFAWASGYLAGKSLAKKA